MRVLVRMTETTARVMNSIACIALVFITLHIFADTIATKYFHAPFNSTHTAVTRYYMVSLVFLALANVELRDSHIKADLLFGALSPRLQRWATGFGLLCLLLFTWLMAWQVWVKAIAQTLRGEKRTIAGDVFLFWPSRWIAVLGMTAFALVALLRLIQFLAGEKPKAPKDMIDLPAGDAHD